LYIPTIGLPILLQEIGIGIYKSFTETGTCFIEEQKLKHC